jgi:hypothetical protein
MRFLFRQTATILWTLLRISVSVKYLTSDEQNSKVDHRHYQTPPKEFIFTEAKAVPLHTRKVHGGDRRYNSYSFSTSTVGGGEWLASRPGCAPGERIPGTHCTGGWVDPRAGLDTG